MSLSQITHSPTRSQYPVRNRKGVKSLRAVAQTNRLPFDRLRANDDMLKSCDFSAHAELVEA